MTQNHLEKWQIALRHYTKWTNSLKEARKFIVEKYGAVLEWEYPLSRRFVYDVLYGFETVESCIDGLLKFTRQLSDKQLENLPKVSKIKPSIHHVATVKQAKTLIKESVHQEDFVAVLPDLMAKIKNVSDFKLGISGEKPKHGNSGYYVLMTIKELKRLLKKE